MCQAFSCLVTKSGKVYWQAGIDSHDRLQSKFVEKDKELKDDKLPPDKTFARIEISPDNKDYIKPDRWSYHVDEKVKPKWLNQSYEKPCWVAFKKWYKKVYSQIDLKELQSSVNPFTINPPQKITSKHKKLLKEWASVRESLEASIWASVETSKWASVWASVRSSVKERDFVWASRWESLEASVWASVWDSVWVPLRASVGSFVRDSVGDDVNNYMWVYLDASVKDITGAYISSLFPKIKNWKYVDKQKPPFNKIRGNPFRSAITLWKMGLVPSYDSYSQVWRLHGGKDARILFEIKKSDLEKI